MNVLDGGCHCGALAARFETARAAERVMEDLGARFCGCSFCRKHGPRWGSDLAGRLTITARADAPPTRYRFGHGTADFVFCPRCGVLLAAACAINRRTLAVANLNVFDAAASSEAPAPLMDHEAETPETRLARRAERWTPLTTVGWTLAATSD